MKFQISGETDTIENVHFAKGAIGNDQIRLSVHSFISDGVLIDTGSSSLQSVFEPFFHAHSFDQIALTHYHEDHTGNAALAQNIANAPTYIHTMSTHLTNQKPRIPIYRKTLWGGVDGFQSTPYDKTFQSENDHWRVIHTPGHTKDHVALLNESKGQLFTGDLYVAPKVKVVLIDENVLDTLDSLKKIQQYDYDHVFCCHAGYVKNHQKMIQYKINFLEDLQGKVLQLAQKGMDVHEITNTLFPKPYPIIEASNTEWSALHIVRAFLNNG